VRTATPDKGKPASPPGPPRWHHLFTLLAAFAAAMVALDLYLSHRYVEITTRSVAVNQAWTERQGECAELGQLAAGVNAPGNDVFQSHQVPFEEDKMRAALRRFDERLGAFQEALRADPDAAETAPLLEELQTVRQRMQDMTGEARGLFAHLRAARTEEAGESMAAMDRQYARAIQALDRLREEIAAIRSRRFEGLAAAATSLQRFDYVVSALILLLVGGSVAYGHRVRRQVDAANREKEGYIAALRDSEAQLEGRVRDRTSELVRVNDALRNEVEDRRRAEEALRQSEARARSLVEMRRQLLKKLISAQEDERRRIARDLHDEIGQVLTSLLIGLRTVAEAPSLDAARGQADALRRITLSAIEEVRRLARGLRPSVLDDLGLGAALERYAADFARTHGVAVEVHAPDPPAGRLPDEIETALYRIAQEALTNTAKHAAAARVRLAVERHPADVQLTVTDDGRGFECGGPEGGRLGLSGMHERAALLDGSVAVESGPGRGTRVTVRIPYAEGNHGEDPGPAGG
jgi:signal transduction histidine kinase